MEKFFFSSLGKVSKGWFGALCERSREKYWGIFPCNDCYIQLAGIVAFDLSGPSDDLRRRKRKVTYQARATAPCWYMAFLFILCAPYQATPGQLHASLCSERHWDDDHQGKGNSVTSRKCFPTWPHLWWLRVSSGVPEYTE